ncbi:MAG: flagellar export chaperone FliS [Vibrionaceae bacterium]
MRGSLQAYKKVSIDSQLTEASPHKVIQMLMAGAIERLIQAKIAIEQKNTPLKGEKIGKALDIVVNLRACLSMEDGGEIAQNLDALYDYIIRQVSLANLDNNTLLLDEAIGILREIKSAWEQIPEKYRNSEPQTE